MRTTGLKRIGACALGASLLLPALAAAAAEEGAKIEEVVVTAQKRAESAQDVGITLTAFSGEELANKGVATSEDLALYTPGLTVNETAATGVPLYTIRGVGFQDYSTAASSTVGLYFDEVAMPYTVMSRGAVFDIQRVEVLKGPQGDLYGRNTTAGPDQLHQQPADQGPAGRHQGHLQQLPDGRRRGLRQRTALRHAARAPGVHHDAVEPGLAKEPDAPRRRARQEERGCLARHARLRPRAGQRAAARAVRQGQVGQQGEHRL